MSSKGKTEAKGRESVTRKVVYVMRALETAVWLDNTLGPTPPHLSRSWGVLQGDGGEGMSRTWHRTMELAAAANPVLTLWMKATQCSY